MLDCKDNCPVLPRVEALEETNKRHGETHREMYDRIRALETENAVQNAHYKAIDEKLDDINVTVKELSGKAGKRWEGLVDKLIYAAALAAVAWAAAGMPGLGG